VKRFVDALKGVPWIVWAALAPAVIIGAIQLRTQVFPTS
jgi:hypothetical protein